jgi:hypothetical protein
MELMKLDKMFELEKRAKDSTAYTDNYPIKFEGFNVDNNFLVFLQHIKKAMPKLKFAPCGAHGFIDKNGVQTRVVSMFNAYMDEFPFVFGSVGYGDFSVGSGCKISYMVKSRRIENSKYSPMRDQYNMIMSTDVKKSVKNACKFIVPFTTKEIAGHSYREFANNLYNVKELSESKLRRATSNVLKHDTIVMEVKNLISQNVSFATEEFKKFASAMFDIIAEQEEERKRNVFGIFVRVRNVGEDTYVDMYEAKDVKRYPMNMQDSSPPTTKLLSELDSELTGNIAVLNILNDKQYVPRVGYKVDNSSFWLERT